MLSCHFNCLELPENACHSLVRLSQLGNLYSQPNLPIGIFHSYINKSNLAFFKGISQWKLLFGTKWWKASGNHTDLHKLAIVKHCVLIPTSRSYPFCKDSCWLELPSRPCEILLFSSIHWRRQLWALEHMPPQLKKIFFQILSMPLLQSFCVPLRRSPIWQ